MNQITVQFAKNGQILTGSLRTVKSGDKSEFEGFKPNSFQKFVGSRRRNAVVTADPQICPQRAENLSLRGNDGGPCLRANEQDGQGKIARLRREPAPTPDRVAVAPSPEPGGGRDDTHKINLTPSNGCTK